MEDSQAELNDISAALNTFHKPAGESAGEERPPLPAAVLQSRLDKERSEKEKEKSQREKLIKQKELMQKQLDDMRAQFELSNAKVGDVVNPSTPSSAKIRWNLL